MLVKEFFDNTLGSWQSHRTYMYPATNKIKSLVTYFSWSNPEDNCYKVNWESDENMGSMYIILSSDYSFKRNIGYFTKEATTSNILNVDSLNLTTSTSYNNMVFEETIQFIDTNHRTRRTIGYKLNKNNLKDKVILSGSYQELKVL